MQTMPHCDCLLLRREGSRLHITLNRPESRNAINSRMAAEFDSILDWLEQDDSIRLVVLRGAGGNFCAGGDIKERREQAQNNLGNDGSDPLVEQNRSGGQALLRFERLPQTTIAVVEGAAFGGGFGYACLADLTILDRNARLGMPETTLGVVPAQIAPFVVRRIGLSRARQLALTAERISGDVAYEWGVGQYLCNSSELEETLSCLAAQIMRCAPKACAVTKDIMLRVGTMPAEELVDYSARRFGEANRSGEGSEGQSAFAEKRGPRWEGEENG